MALSAFGKAFRAARDAGDTEFEFNGKKYNTKLKDEDSSSKSESKKSGTPDLPVTKGSPTSNYSNEGRGSKPTSKASTNFAPGASDEEKAANRQAIADTVSAIPKAIGNYVSNFKTPAERRSEEAKNPTPKASKPDDTNEDALSSGSAMKRGGSVKKMASGGMTSSRADGIAQRGKTRCKIC